MNTPSLTDGIVLLDALTLGDARAHLAGEDEEQARRFGWYPARSTLGRVKAWIREREQDWHREGPTRVFAVRDARTRALAGGCELRLQPAGVAEQSYWTFPGYRGRGFATHAIILASAFAFRELGLHRLELRIEPDNRPSRAVARSAGYAERGLAESEPWSGGDRRAMVLYILTRGEPVIRTAVPADAAAIAAVHVRSWQWAYRGQLPDTFLDGLSETLERRTAMWRDRLEQGREQGRTWVAEVDGQIAGFADAGPSREGDATPETGEVNAIYLEQRVAGMGAGRALFARAIEFLRQQGYRMATLWVLSSNDRARRFYEKAGWRPDGATKVEERPGFQLAETRYRVDLVGGTIREVGS